MFMIVFIHVHFTLICFCGAKVQIKNENEINYSCQFITNWCYVHNKLFKTCKNNCKKCAIFAHFIDIFSSYTQNPPFYPSLTSFLPCRAHPASPFFCSQGCGSPSSPHPFLFLKKGPPPTPGSLPLQGGHPAALPVALTLR